MDILNISNILFAVIGALISALWITFSDRIKELKTDTKGLEKEMHEIKYNYLNRFEEVKGLINEVKEVVIEQKTLCTAIQDAKKKED